MNSKQAKDLFDKYLNNTCTEQERRLLEEFLDSFQDQNKLWTELRFEDQLKEKIWAKIQQDTTQSFQSKQRRLPFMNILKYAAIFVGVALSAFVLLHQNNEQDVSGGPSLVIDDQKIILHMGNRENAINENAVSQISDDSGTVLASQEGNVLTYNYSESIKELVYNEIEVPRGKTFKVVLSDGTSVHLNAGTSFKFPVNFLPGQERKVFLEGEAYFEVTKDTQRPFLVNANDMDVTVLGTSFNVHSYEGTATNTVLVEGSVAVQHRDQMKERGKPQIIIPGEKATLSGNVFEINKVDVSAYIGWTEDLLIFNDESFADIVKKIERKYNVDIKNNYPDLAAVKFNGKFKEETITDLMDTFKESAGFDYHIQDNKIIINKKKSANVLKTTQ